MSILKEDYILIKTKTIDYFFEFFQNVIKRINTQKVLIGQPSSHNYPEDHYLKDAITELTINETENTITFKILNKEIIFMYDIYPRVKDITAKIKTYRYDLAYTIPYKKLYYLKGLDICFGDHHNNYKIAFECIDYNKQEFRTKDKTISEYFDEYLQMLATSIFIPGKVQETKQD